MTMEACMGAGGQAVTGYARPPVIDLAIGLFEHAHLD